MADPDCARDIRLALFNAYVFYDLRPRPEKLDIMVDLLDGYSGAAVQAAIRQWMLLPPEKGHKPRPPMPNELIALMDPAPSIDEQAAELAGMLQGMVIKWGNPHGAKARAELPPIAWDVMTLSYGSWQNFCATSFESNMETRRAQLRDSFKAALKRGHANPLLNSHGRQQLEGGALPKQASMFSAADVAQALLSGAKGNHPDKWTDERKQKVGNAKGTYACERQRGSVAYGQR